MTKRTVKRVKGVCRFAGVCSGEACSLSVLRTIGDDFTVCPVIHSTVCLKNLWYNRVHFPLRPPKAVFFHHGTSQYDFM